MALALPPQLRAAPAGSRRLVLLGAAAAGILGLWLMAQWAMAPAWVPLYGELELGQSALVTEKLEKAGIRFRLSPDGTAVQVAAADVAQARVTLARDGLPASGRPGLELFDKPAWGMTDFTERVTYQRALEGELARTIGKLRGIKGAEVHLVLPQASALRKLERPAEASVVVTLQPGAALAPETVTGITHLVSSSVDLLAADAVAVLDDQGRLLSRPLAEEGPVGATTRQLEVQRSVEERLEARLAGLLESVLGAGRARVQVAADLDFAQVDRTVEAYDPDRAVLQSEQKSEGGDAESEYGATSSMANTYQNSRTVERTVGATGTVRRLSVAVLVDERPAGDSAAAPVAPAELATLERMVRDAVGADSARGDRVTVMAMPFRVLPEGELAAGAPTGFVGRATEFAERAARPGLGLVAMGAMLLLAWKAIAGAKVPAAAPAPAAAGAAAPAVAGTPPLPELAPVGPPPEALALRNRVVADSSERPDTAAAVMRAWLAEPS